MKKAEKEFKDIYVMIDELEANYHRSKASFPQEANIIIESLLMINKVLLNKVEELTRQINLNSKNSSKPPSSDRFNFSSKRKQEDESTKRTPGGQKGHKGFTLNKVGTPDKVIKHKAKTCSNCGKSLKDMKCIGHETRQVFDINIEVIVTEHRAEQKTCNCGTSVTAQFPEGINQPVQYSSYVRALATYLSQIQLIPYERLAEVFNDVFKLSISQGSLNNFNTRAYENLKEFEEGLKEVLGKSSINHSDETGMNISGKLNWLHNVSNNQFTLLNTHEKRGQIAMEEIGVLGKYQGTVVHDHWQSYYKYGNFKHALCNAHHLRELRAVHELDGQGWAEKMMQFLVNINVNKQKLLDLGKTSFNKRQFEKCKEEYQKILIAGYKECPIKKTEPYLKKRGRPKKTKARNLLERLDNRREDVLRFAADFEVPFTNNQAERDLRMSKVKQKISGCFRSESGSKIFARIRSYISTARKQKINVLTALLEVFKGEKLVQSQMLG